MTDLVSLHLTLDLKRLGEIAGSSEAPEIAAVYSGMCDLLARTKDVGLALRAKTDETPVSEVRVDRKFAAGFFAVMGTVALQIVEAPESPDTAVLKRAAEGILGLQSRLIGAAEGASFVSKNSLEPRRQGAVEVEFALDYNDGKIELYTLTSVPGAPATEQAAA